MIKKLLIFILTFAPAVFFMTRPGYYIMHDDMQMIRQLQMEKCFDDGQFPCRWGPDLGYGYGYPIFNFYPPLPYIVGQLTRFLGFSFVDTVKINAILQFLVAYVAMYLLGKKIGGSKVGFIAALFYTYAPYHFNNIYIRGAYNEAWASSFFPLIVLSILNIFESTKAKYVLMLAFSTAAILLSHNPMVILIAPGILLLTIALLFKHKNIRPIGSLALAGIISLGLSSFFTLPVLFETKYVQIETMFSNYYSYVAHFTSLKQLFTSSFWGNGPSFFGPKDGMPFTIGWLHWILPILGSAISIHSLVKNKKLTTQEMLILLFSFLGMLNLFLSHERSGPIWSQISLLQKVQFPWRLLNVATFFMSIAAGISTIMLSERLKNKYIPFFVIMTLMVVNMLFAKPLQSGPLTDAEKFSGKAWSNLVTSGIYDYLPKAARIAPQGPAGPGVDEVLPKGNQIELISSKQGSDWNLISLNAKEASTLFISRFDFPGTKVFVNGNLTTHRNEPELGRIVLDVPAGQNLIYIKLTDTPIRSIANLISITTLFLIGVFSIWGINKKRSLS